MKKYYFHIAQGLRGGYMSDTHYIIETTTRKGLKDALESEAYSMRDAGYVGLSKRSIAWLAAECWRNRNKVTLDFVVPYRYKDQDGYPYGIFCSASSKTDYKEYVKDNE